MKKTLSLVTALALLLSTLCGCKAQPKYEKFSDAIFDSFDTVISVVSYQENQAQFDELMSYTRERFAQLNQLFDIYNDYDGINNVKTINDAAGKSPVKVDGEIIRLIEFSQQWYEKSQGKVNIALGSVLRIWHDTREAAEGGNIEIPSMERLKSADEHTDISKIVIDHENSTVFLPDSEMSLDVGAVAKGYATEIICDELSAKYDNFAISAGGNVKTHGHPKDGRTRWGVGIQNPEVDENYQMVGGNIDLAFIGTDRSLVCSGGYQRFFVHEGRRYHHLIDPDTLFPEEYYQGVTVMCEDSGVADALSTAIFMMESDKAIEFIENIEGADCLLILKDGTIVKSKGMDGVLKSQGIESDTPC
ncbi:MAG: FAD:protein FMN transferase [Oscillospiraceae bacterium]